MLGFLKQRLALILFAAVTVGIGGWLLYILQAGEDKSVLLPGITTHGHYQIELECGACHTNEKAENIFTSSGVHNSSCLQCHGEDLEEFSDSHPVRKFKNPENAVFLQHVDALSCVACHQEHNEKVTHPMGVTIPPDYCAHCHQVTLDSLETHKNLGFETCATAGCHNYHDNMALAPSFLLKHFAEPEVHPEPVVKQRDALARWIADGAKPRESLTLADSDAIDGFSQDASIEKDWAASAHAKAGINCSDCHGSEEQGNWIARPGYESCKSCHAGESETFLKGKHGMRLAHGLSPMTPGQARAEMNPHMAHAKMDCNACHQTHAYDTQYAASKACMECHQDSHSKNYAGSPHEKLWLAELSGEGKPGTGVSCATCHMPRVEMGKHVLVSHDQTANLRPNDKMLRSVCMDCHGLEFSMDALADESLIESNFSGRPATKHEGVDWAVKTAVSKGNEQIIELLQQIKNESQSDGLEPPKTETNQKNKTNE